MTDTPPTAPGSAVVGTNELAIVAVAELCAMLHARSADLFEFCGRQITNTDPGPQQRWWAKACHQHAWHIELADARMPTIPLVDPPQLIGAASQATASSSEASAPDARWRTVVAELRTLIGDGLALTDPTLDPSTARMLALVDADLSQLGDELSGFVDH